MDPSSATEGASGQSGAPGFDFWQSAKPGDIVVVVLEEPAEFRIWQLIKVTSAYLAPDDVSMFIGLCAVPLGPIDFSITYPAMDTAISRYLRPGAPTDLVFTARRGNRTAPRPKLLVIKHLFVNGMEIF